MSALNLMQAIICYFLAIVVYVDAVWLVSMLFVRSAKCLHLIRGGITLWESPTGNWGVWPQANTDANRGK